MEFVEFINEARARREGESARLALEQARQHCKVAKQKAKAAAQKPLRRKGVRRGLRYYSDFGRQQQ